LRKLHRYIEFPSYGEYDEYVELSSSESLQKTLKFYVGEFSNTYVIAIYNNDESLVTAKFSLYYQIICKGYV
jgi:hypothetical protein